MILSLAAGLLWKSWSICFSRRLMEGKQNFPYVTKKNNETETPLRLKPENSSRTGWCRNFKNNTQITMKTILIPLPRSYGINFGNHISPGKYNCVRFSVSTVSWIYLTAQGAGILEISWLETVPLNEGMNPWGQGTFLCRENSRW